MRVTVWILALWTFAATAFSQQANPEKSSSPEPSAPSSAEGRSDRSVVHVQPGPEAIKNKDLWEKTGYFHPFLRMPKYILQDQKAIWTSPFHTAKSDVKWWIIFGTVEAALLATDKWTIKQFPNTAFQQHLGNDFSAIGAGYTLIPIGASFYLLGTARGNERFREAGILSFEALIDATIVETLVKVATDRARPLEANHRGGFWESTGSLWNASFPSGHAINSFALASVFAHEYPHSWWVKIVAYGGASIVVGARLAARKHFPGDVFAGSVMGWFIGDYVYGKRHNDDLDAKPSLSRKILDHVHFGGSY